MFAAIVDGEGKKIDPLALSSELDRIISETDSSNEHLWRKYHSRFELWRETRLELTRAVISFGQVAIRSLVLINGGAAIAVLTFIGNFTQNQNSLMNELSYSLLSFCFGAAAAALVAGFAYVTQFLYDGFSKKASRIGTAFHILAVFFAIASFTLFIVGVLTAFWGFQGTLQIP
jgi:hypothetical protein